MSELPLASDERCAMSPCVTLRSCRRQLTPEVLEIDPFKCTPPQCDAVRHSRSPLQILER
jgi:hypothetical protein